MLKHAAKILLFFRKNKKNSKKMHYSALFCIFLRINLENASASSIFAAKLTKTTTKTTTMTRGIRNNNPLNLRCSSSPWKGKVLVNNDGTFEQFISMEYGFRAAILTIETYIIKHGCNTICKIISRWAPASDGNNTERYIHFVCGFTNIGGNEPISNHDKRLKDIVWAMAHMESGNGILDFKESLDKAFESFEPKEVYEKIRKKKY